MQHYNTLTLLLLSFIPAAFCTVYSSCVTPGDIALTFDGGPSPYTGNLLNVLSSKDTKVTFHFSGEYLNVPYVSAYAKQAYSDGHLIGLQTKEDIMKISIGDEAFFSNLVELQKKIQSVVGVKPKFLRIPYSAEAFPSDVISKLESMGFVLSISNLDTQDYLYANKTGKGTEIFDNFKGQLDQIVPPAKGSFISTQHDIVARSVEQTGDILDYLKKKGYNQVTMEECAKVSVSKDEDDQDSKKDKDAKKDPKNKEDIKKDANEDKSVKNNAPGKARASNGSALEYCKLLALPTLLLSYLNL